MRVAILSDLHGELHRLESVLAALEPWSPERWVCLGDIVGLGAGSAACGAWARAQATLVVQGNHDQRALTPAQLAARTPRQLMAAAPGAAVSEELAGWLRQLPLSASRWGYHFSHGSPLHPARFDYLETLKAAAHVTAAVAPRCVVGHNHAAFALEIDGLQRRRLVAPWVQLEPGRRYVISVGSVARSRDADPRPCGVLLDTESQEVRWVRGV